MQILCNQEKSVSFVFINPHNTTNTPDTSLFNKINVNNNTKFMGVFIDHNLSFTNHIDMINKKVNSACYLMEQMKNKVSIEALKSVYFA